jgi:hypothetical protein
MKYRHRRKWKEQLRRLPLCLAGLLRWAQKCEGLVHCRHRIMGEGNSKWRKLILISSHANACSIQPYEVKVDRPLCLEIDWLSSRLRLDALCLHVLMARQPLLETMMSEIFQLISKRKSPKAMGSWERSSKRHAYLLWRNSSHFLAFQDDCRSDPF